MSELIMVPSVSPVQFLAERVDPEVVDEEILIWSSCKPQELHADYLHNIMNYRQSVMQRCSHQGKLKSGKLNQSVHISWLFESQGRSSMAAEKKSEFVTVSLTSL